jgi:hypothetical protein
MADAHEADMAEWTDGRLQKASGSQWHAQGDTKNGEFLVAYPITGDGKATMGKSISISRDMWKKIVAQTFNQNPALFLRFYQPGENLRTVDIDLAVTSVSLFTKILRDARKWQALEDAVAGDGSLEVEDLHQILDDAQKWREHSARVEMISSRIIPLEIPPEQDAAWREMVQLGQDMGRKLYFCPTAEEVESQPGGGFDQCCSSPEYHVPLPNGYGTEKLTQILSARLQRMQRVQVVQHDGVDELRS